MAEKQLLQIIGLLIATCCTSASYLVPDTSFMFRHCIGPACPTFSLPMKVDRPGTIHSLNCSKGDLIPDLVDCQSFYACGRNGTAIKLTCTIGYAFHPRIKLCVPQSMVKSCGKVYCPPSILIGTVPDPANCTRYYRCVYGVPMHFQCEPGFSFDEEIGKCMENGESVPVCINGEIAGNSTNTENPVTTTSTPTTSLPDITTDDIVTEEPISVPTSSETPII